LLKTFNRVKIVDVIFALIAGRIIGFLADDFLMEWGVNTGIYWDLVIWIAFPLFSLFCLWMAFLIGDHPSRRASDGQGKFLFVFQAAKFFLVGAVATVLDLKIFEFLVWFFSIYILAKVISFIIATFLKYWGNKYWAFLKHEKENIHKEIIRFFLITFIGLIIDVAVFYYLTRIMEPQFALSYVIWTKLSVIFAGVAAALWNFLGYKFLVFKK